MISVEEARERVLGYFGVLEPETRPILEADGQVLAEDVEGRFDIPPLDNSAMDGYALRTEDIRGASETSAVTLRVTGAVAAGQLPTVRVEPGTAIRIMTGAPIPEGADAVVPFEDTDEVDRRASGRTLSEIGIREEVPPEANVRPAGQDMRAGSASSRAAPCCARRRSACWPLLAAAASASSGAPWPLYWRQATSL